MSLLLDKVRPLSLDDFIINREIALKLKKYIHSGELLNTLISGRDGCGKYTLALAILNEYYGMGIYKKSTTNFKLKVGTNIKSIDVLYSNYHYEIFINQYLFNDKITLLMLIKNIIETYNINTNSYNIILIKSLNFVSNNTITLFKSLMQEYVDTCRFIFICNKNSKINILKPFILHIKIPPFNKKNIITFLKSKSIHIKDKNSIIETTKGNLNKLFCLLETNQDKILIDEYLEKFINILNTKGIKTIDKIREHLYNYICKNFNKQLIYLTIIDHYIKLDSFDNDKKREIIKISAKFQHRQAISYREIIHLEAYLVNIFKIIHS
jgi:DNA polymerase III delta prime subunit